MESDVLVKGNDIVERSSAKKRDKVAADRKEDEDHVDMEDQCSSTSNG